MFLFKASRYLEELKKFQPEIYDYCNKATLGMKKRREFLTVDKESFISCPADSIDYAVMEQTAHAMMVPLSAGWSDIVLGPLYGITVKRIVKVMSARAM